MKRNRYFASGLLTWQSLLVALVLISGLSACYYDNEEDLYPTGGCDISNVKFSTDVYPVIQANCNTCHNAADAQGNVVLEGYDFVKNWKDRLVGTMRHDVGYSPMPKGGSKLDKCTIDKIAQWIADGAQNN